MKHRKKGKKLGRSTGHRKALFRNLIGSLIIKGEIKTTEAKAKAIKRLVDRLIGKAKAGSLHVRRQIMAFLPNKKAANKLVDVVAPIFKNRTSGFTRIIKLGWRQGDNAPMAKIELVEKEAKVKNERVAKKTNSAPAVKAVKKTQKTASKTKTKQSK